MKRTSLWAAALLLAAVPVVAQAQTGAEFGLKGGVSFGNISNKGVLPGNLDNRTGFAAGVSVATTGLIGIGGEALFAQRGIKSDVAGDGTKVDYVDIPVYLRVMAPTPGIKPFAYAGPQVSFELRCKANDADCPDVSPGGAERKKTDFAAVIGGGAQFGGENGRFSLEGRYIYGLTDLKLGTVTDANSYKTRSFLILAGFVF